MAWGLAVFMTQSGGYRNTMDGWSVREGAWSWQLRQTWKSGTKRLYWTPVQTAAPDWQERDNTGRPDYLLSRAPALEPIGPAARPPAWSYAAANRPDPRECKDALYIEVGWGWPLITASYQYRRLGTGWSDPTSAVAGAIDLGIKPDWFGTLGLGTREVLALPIRPAFAGLAANSALFAAAWLLALYGPRTTAAVWRRRHGRCGGCGYDLSAVVGARCPECGDTVVRATNPEG